MSENGAQAQKLSLTPEQAVVYFAFDMVLHTLAGHASQMQVSGHAEVARQFQRFAEQIAEKRDKWVRQEQTGIKVVSALEMPVEPEAS